MRKMHLALFLGFFLVFASNVNAQMSKSQLQQMYVSYLREQGYQPEVDSDGDVTFRAEGSFLYISVYENDLEYFCIVLPGFWEIESESERRQVTQAASNVMRSTKLVRIYMIGSNNTNTSIQASIFLSKPEDFKKHFKRMLDIILTSRKKFLDEMR